MRAFRFGVVAAFARGGDEWADKARRAESLGYATLVTPDGPHYAFERAEVSPRPLQQPRPPIMVAGSGRRLLELAAREADIVALGVAPDAPEDAVAEKIGWRRQAAGSAEGFDQLELNLKLMAVGQQVPRYIS